MVKVSILLYSLFKKKKVIAVSITAVLLLSASLSVYSTKFGTDLSSYIPEDAKKTGAYLEALRHSGGERNCYIILKGDILNNIDLIDRISSELKMLPEIVDIQYRIDRDMRDFYMNLMKKNLPLYMDSDELEALFRRLTPEGIKDAIKKTRLRMMMPAGGELSRIDPLGLTDFIKPFPVTEGFVDTSSGYYLLDGGKGLIMVASVSGDPRDIDFDRRLMSGIDAVMKRHLNAAISATVTGSHAITYYEATKMKEEMKINIFVSILLIVIVLVIFVRDIKLILYAFVPVGTAIPISLGIYTLLFGALTEAAGGFATMLIGLGVDFTIILYIRNIFLKNIEHSIQATASGIWAGALTTAVTFFPMFISSFRGVRELGILTGMGIVFCAIASFSIVANLIRPCRSKKLSIPSTPQFSDSKMRLFNGIVILLALLFSLWTIRDIRFSIDLKELGFENNPARLALEEIMATDSKKVFITGEAKDPYDAAAKASMIERLLRDANIKDIISISTLMPPLEKQLSVIERLKGIDNKIVVSNFTESARQAGFSRQFIDDYAKGLSEMLSVSRPLSYDDIKGIALFKERFIWPKENGIGFLMIINNSEAKNIPRIDSVTVADRDVIKDELMGLLKIDALKITVIGFLSVNIILFITFRRLSYIFLAQVPIIIAVLLTSSFLTITGRNIHIMSALTGVMLFGIGTDYAIHLLCHIRKEKDIVVVMSQTGTGIMLSALTTICGFGSLYFSSYRGLSDMGFATTIGILFCLIFTFMFVPFFSYKKAKT